MDYAGRFSAGLSSNHIPWIGLVSWWFWSCILFHIYGTTYHQPTKISQKQLTKEENSVKPKKKKYPKIFTYTLHEDTRVPLSSDGGMNICRIFREVLIDPNLEPPIYSFLVSPRPISGWSLDWRILYLNVSGRQDHKCLDLSGMNYYCILKQDC